MDRPSACSLAMMAAALASCSAFRDRGPGGSTLAIHEHCLFCGEWGGGVMNLLTKGADGKQIQSKNVGFGTVNLGAEVQYNLGSAFHVGAKVGGGFSFGQFSAERADGSRIFGSSSGLSWSAYVLLGAGVHF